MAGDSHAGFSARGNRLDGHTREIRVLHDKGAVLDRLAAAALFRRERLRLSPDRCGKCSSTRAPCR
jgi:hypothetical protein